MAVHLLAIDQGTTSSRAMVFDAQCQPVSVAQQEFTQHFPSDGWVEHDPEDIWQSVVSVVREALEKARLTASDISAIGITNQRETTLVWDAVTGETIHPAIVWQDRRTSAFCDRLQADGHEQLINERTGLLIDPYFSATKLNWLLDNVDGARQRAEQGELRFGTVDCFLLWRLSGGKVHRTDASNASRTMLFNIHTQQWDTQLLELLNIPASLLPEVLDNTAEFGDTDPALFGSSIPITAMAGDQQAALVGQACFAPGSVKSTYGTGCFMVMNTGNTPVHSSHRLLTTVAYRLDGQTTYALEGSIFVAGAAIQWLRDGLKLIRHADETEALAEQVGDQSGVYLVPAFTGLGAPYWDPQARGAILGLTRDTGIAEIVTAGLQSVCFQTRDLLEAMQADSDIAIASLRVDGGMVVNKWMVQALANTLGVQVDRPQVTETTALGVACLAGLQQGLFGSLEDIARHWDCERSFDPVMPGERREKLYAGWLDAVQRVRGSVRGK